MRAAGAAHRYRAILSKMKWHSDAELRTRPAERHDVVISRSMYVGR